MKKINDEKFDALVEGIRELVKKELSARKPLQENAEPEETHTKKWDVVDAAKKVFNANYVSTNFPAGSHEGRIAIVSPTMHQLNSFENEIKGHGSVTTIDSENDNGKNCVVVKVKLHGAPR